jgi:hydrogenase maturation protease
MSPSPVRCLILACGNTLRSDDGVGPWLADWAEKEFSSESSIRVIVRQQWTPDLAEEISASHSVLFIDCSVESKAGAVQLATVHPAPPLQGLATHHLGASELLALALELYGSRPSNAMQLTIGAGSIELGETFSEAVLDALPEVCRLVEETVVLFLREPQQ